MARGRVAFFFILIVVALQVDALDYNRNSRDNYDREDHDTQRTDNSANHNKKKSRSKTFSPVPTDTTGLETFSTFANETTVFRTKDNAISIASYDNSVERAHWKDADISPQNSVSTGVAVGLLVLGLVVGAIVTCLLCVCVPSLNKKATSFLTRHRIPIDDEKKDKKGPVLDSQVRPSVPPASFRSENESNFPANNQRDSHIYNRIQTDSGPIEMGLVNSKNSAQSSQTSQAIALPIYNVLTDDIMASSSQSSEPDYQPLKDRSQDEAAYGYRSLEHSGNGSKFQNRNKDVESGPLGSASTVDHNYFILKPDSATPSDMGSGVQEDTDSSAHAYFVLEKNSNS